MKKPLNARVIAGAALALASATQAQAALIHDAGALLAPAPVIDFEAYDGFITGGPEGIAPGVTFTGGQEAELGAYIRDLGQNGVWGVGNHFAASGADGLLTFTFDSLQAGVGAFVNLYRNDSLAAAITITVRGSDNGVLETHGFGVGTGVEQYNEGAFLGILRGAADIRSVTFSGVGAVADNLVHTTAVPEPESLALLLGGLGIVLATAGFQRRQAR